MELKQAGISDIQGIVRYMEEYHSTSNLSDVPFDKKSSTKIVEHYIKARDCCAFITTDGDDVTGLLFGSLEPFFFNQKKTYATDLMFFAKGHGSDLWKMFKAWAFARGADRIIMGVSSGSERADNLLDVLGMTKTGGMYVLRQKSS